MRSDPRPSRSARPGSEASASGTRFRPRRGPNRKSPPRRSRAGEVWRFVQCLLEHLDRRAAAALNPAMGRAVSVRPEEKCRIPGPPNGENSLPRSYSGPGRQDGRTRAASAPTRIKPLRQLALFSVQARRGRPVRRRTAVNPRELAGRLELFCLIRPLAYQIMHATASCPIPKPESAWQ